MTFASHRDAITLRDRPITDNERAWVEFIRLASGDTDPAPSLKTVQALRKMFSDGSDPASRA